MKEFSLISSACIALVLAVSTAAAAEDLSPEAALFSEDFNGITGGGNGNQWQTGLPLKHSAGLVGWTRTGLNSIHAVQRSHGNWALQLFGTAGASNVLTQKTGFAANVRGKTYTVSFDVGPSVWAARGQATAANDQVVIELLRGDSTILVAKSITSGAWTGEQTFVHRTFTYEGDGSGDLRFRLSPKGADSRFYGAIDNLQVFDSAEAAKRSIELRLAREKEREFRHQKLSVLEQDWLFQASGAPTIDIIQQEITATHKLAERILAKADDLDLGRELATVDRLESELTKSDPFMLYLELRRIKRHITMKNPAVDFSEILLVDNPYPNHRHESGHRHGYRAAGSGRLLVLEGLDPDSPVRPLVPDQSAGFFWRPDLAFDASKVVFCMMPPGERSFHLYEVNADGSGMKQLTRGDYDDLDPIYLPDGHLLFTTTRAHTYVRCGPSHHSPVLARCDGDGTNIYVISRNSEPDYLPSLLPDGRVIYTRWEYTDKEQKRTQSLWTMNPDGTGVFVFWGNQSVWPDMLVEPRPIPGTGKIIFTGVGHHQWFNGSIGIIDPSKGMNYPKGLTKVTPEVAWPEVGNGPAEKPERGDYRRGRYPAYKTPYPISEEDFLVSIRHPQTGKFSLYLMDLRGNRELIYTGKDNVLHAQPLRPRPVPPAIPNRVAWPQIGPNQEPLAEGILYSADVFEGEPRLPRERVKYLRVLQIDAKTYTPWKKTYQHSGPSISITQADGVKRILGTTPVESDGSVCLRVPPGRALHFQLLDEDYRCVQTMRSFTGVMPGETRGCVGCYEGRSPTPVNTGGGFALRRGPQALTPPPWGTEESIGYVRFVQPVLDRYCGRCHQGDGKARKKLDLTFRASTVADPVFPGMPPQFSEPYVTLVGGGNNWYQPVSEKLINTHGMPASISGCLIVEGYRERTPEALATLAPKTCMSSASLLIDRAMDEDHMGTKIGRPSLRRLIGWVDANGPYLGEEEIRAMPDPAHRPEFHHPYGAPYSIPMPVIQPRLKTAPRINRFNIRQDGDTSEIYLKPNGK